MDNTKQVIAVAKISSPARPVFRGRQQLVHTRRVEQLLAVPVPSPRDCVIAQTLGEEEEGHGGGTLVRRRWPQAPVYWTTWGLLVAVGHKPQTVGTSVGGNHRQPRAVYKWWVSLR